MFFGVFVCVYVRLSGIITRNSSESVDKMLSYCGLQLHFHPILTRNFPGGFKPDPAPLLEICSQWNMSAHHVIMVGDSIDDIMCGQRAHCRTCLVENSDNTHIRATFRIKHLSALIDIIEDLNSDCNTVDK